MKNVYAVFIAQKDSDYLVYIPDFEIYTEGDSFFDAIEMARDAIALDGVYRLEHNQEFPEVSSKEEAIQKAKSDADDIFDYSQGTLTYVDVDFDTYRAKLRNKAVKKNCTLPAWLAEKAELQGINFSRVLQEALLQKIG